MLVMIQVGEREREREQRKYAACEDTSQYTGQLCRRQQIILRDGQQSGTFLAMFKNTQSPMATGGGEQRIDFTMGNR